MTPTNHPAPESEREAVKRIIRDGFNSGSSITAIADAILSRRMGAEPVAGIGQMPESLRGFAAWLRNWAANPSKYSDPILMTATQLDEYADCLERLRTASPPASALDARTVEAQAVKVLREMVEAYDAGHLKMESPELGEPENDIPYHPWHEEMLHYARLAIRADRGK